MSEYERTKLSNYFLCTKEKQNKMFLHLIFNITASASVDADIRIGRRRHPHRSAQTLNVTLRLFFNNVRMSKY